MASAIASQGGDALVSKKGNLGKKRKKEETRYRSYSQDKRAPPADAPELKFQGILSKKFFKDISFPLNFVIVEYVSFYDLHMSNDFNSLMINDAY